jgi:hypothetical protein
MSNLIGHFSQILTKEEKVASRPTLVEGSAVFTVVV